jgi:hypothetical protein
MSDKNDTMQNIGGWGQRAGGQEGGGKLCEILEGGGKLTKLSTYGHLL